MISGFVRESDERQHHRHLYQHPHDRNERRAGVQAEDADRDGDGEFEEVGRADQGAGRCHIVGHAPCPGCCVGNDKDAVGLDQERDGRSTRLEADLQHEDMPLEAE